MKTFYSVFFLILINLSSFSQDNKDIAKIYFKKAKESYLNQDFEKTERYLNKTVKYLGSIETEEVATFGAKFHFQNQNYLKSKAYLSAFFKLNKNKNSKTYTDMLLLYTDTLDAIDNPDKFKKEKKKVSPNIDNKVKKKIKNTEFIEDEKTKDIIDINEETKFFDEQRENEEVKDIPFILIENVPVFPGCEGTKNEKKTCFSKMVQVHFATFFDADLPNTLGLTKGRKKILIAFIINKKGNVVNVKVKAPHPLITKEVIRVMSLLPTMTPGTQRGKNVNVKYAIPFTIIVQ